MKRAVKLFLLAFVSSLLLTGCEGLPTNMEELINWRGNFLLNITASQLQDSMGMVLALLTVVALAKGFATIIQSAEKGISLFSLDGKLIGVFAVLLSIVLVYTLIPTANLLTNIVLKNLTIDEVFKNLDIGLQLATNSNIVVAGWAVAISVALPQMVTGALLYSLMASMVLILVSTIVLTNKSVWIIISIWAGHFLFLSFYIVIVTLIGKISLAWAFGIGKTIGYLLYVGLTLLFWVICYFAIPFCTVLFGPEIVGPRMKHHKEPSGDGLLKRVANQAKKIDLDTVIPIFVSGNKRKPTEYYETETLSEDPVTDGVWEPVPELKPGFPELPPPTNYVGPTKSETNPTQPPQGDAGTGSNFTNSKTYSTFSPEKQIPPEFVGNDQPNASLEKQKSEKIAKTRSVVSKVVTVGAIAAGIVAKNPEVGIKVSQAGAAIDSFLGAAERVAKKQEEEDLIPIQFSSNGNQGGI